MSKLTGRGFSAQDAEEFIERTNGSHTARWRASSYRFIDGTATLLKSNVPIVSGELTLDSSNPTRRQLSIEVAIGPNDELIPNDPADPLVPFGQYLVVWLDVDRGDGISWFPSIKMGEFPITSYVFERPSMIVTVEAADWSSRVEEYLHLGKTGYKNKPSVRAAIIDMVSAAVPEKLWDIGQFNQGSGMDVGKYTVDASVGRWTAATELADRNGLEIFFDDNGDLCIRRAITRDNDSVVPSDGPDIGTVKDPVATIAEGTNLVGMTSSLTREGGCNHVRINLTGTVTRRDKKQDTEGKGSAGIETHQKKWSDHVDSTTDSGPVAFGSTFGKLPLVLETNLHRLGQTGSGEKDAQRERAKGLRQRRLGLIKYIDLDALGCYQLEPDDKVKLKFGGVTEDHYVQSVTFDLTGQSATRIRTRQIATTNPTAEGL